MTVIDVCLTVLLPLLVILTGASLAALAMKSEAPAPVINRYEEQWDTLTFCQTCGCRHREAFMAFRDDGRYMCKICCHDKP